MPGTLQGDAFKLENLEWFVNRARSLGATGNERIKGRVGMTGSVRELRMSVNTEALGSAAAQLDKEQGEIAQVKLVRIRDLVVSDDLFGDELRQAILKVIEG